MDAVLYALRHPKSKVYLFRETYKMLEKNLIDELFRTFPEQTKENPLGMFKYDKSGHIATFTNGSRIYFSYVNNLSDAKSYTGAEIDYLGIDELTQHEEESIDHLISCMRSPLGYPTKFRATSNPGGEGHVWVKKRFVDATYYGKEIVIDPVTQEKIEFIPAKVTDNLVLMKKDPNYANRLKNLPTELRKAFLDGNWEIFENQCFDEFRLDIHTCPHFEPPEHWRRWRSNDPGYHDPFAWYWLAVDEDGIVHVYREFTRDYEDPKIQYSEQSTKVIEMSKMKIIDIDGNVVIKPEKIDFTVIGHDAWQHAPTTKTAQNPRGKCIKDHYEDGGLNDFIRAITDRQARCSTLHEYFRVFKDENTGKLRSKILIHDNCTKLIETIPLQVVDPDGLEKYKDTNFDHQVDSLGYGLLAYHADRSKPVPQPETKMAKHKKSIMKRLSRKKR